MGLEIALLFRQVINAVQLWFTQFFHSTGMTGFYLSMIFIYLLVRILLSNFISSSGSDSASGKSSNSTKSLPPGKSQ